MELAGRWTIIHGSRSDVFRLWPLGDLHVPSVAFDEALFLHDRKEIEQDPYSIAVGLGDYGEFITPKDEKRWDARIVDRSVAIADLAHYGTYIMDRVVDYLNPIRGQLLGVAEGNHEYEYAKRHDLDPTRYLADVLKVPYLGYWSLMELVFIRRSQYRGKPRLVRGRVPSIPGQSAGSVTVVLCVHHGSGAARTAGGRANKSLEASRQWLANIFIMGHLHDALDKPFPLAMLEEGGEHYKAFPRLCVIAGSYAKGYVKGVTTFPERYEMPLNTLGSTPIEIRPACLAQREGTRGKVHRANELRISIQNPSITM